MKVQDCIKGLRLHFSGRTLVQNPWSLEFKLKYQKSKSEKEREKKGKGGEGEGGRKGGRKKEILTFSSSHKDIGDFSFEHLLLCLPLISPLLVTPLTVFFVFWSWTGVFGPFACRAHCIPAHIPDFPSPICPYHLDATLPPTCSHIHTSRQHHYRRIQSLIRVFQGLCQALLTCMQ